MRKIFRKNTTNVRNVIRWYKREYNIINVGVKKTKKIKDDLLKKKKKMTYLNGTSPYYCVPPYVKEQAIIPFTLDTSHFKELSKLAPFPIFSSLWSFSNHLLYSILIYEYLFLSALGPRPLGPLKFIVTFSRNRLVWPGWSTKILHKNVVIFNNTTHINRRTFHVLFVQGTFSTKPFVNSHSGIVASINTTDIKVCRFRGLSRDLINVWNWDILRSCAIEKLHKFFE